MIELAAGRSTITMGGLAVEALPPGAVIGRRLQQPLAVASALSQALAVLAPRTRRAAVAVPTSATTTSRLCLPADLDDADIAAHLEWDSDKYFAVPFTELAIDFHRLQQDDSSAAHQDIEVVACLESRVSQLVTLLRDVDLEPVAVDLEHLALQRALHGLACDRGRGGVVLVDLHADLVAVHIWQQGDWVCSRDFPRPGGDTMVARSDEAYALDQARLVVACVALCGMLCSMPLPDRVFVGGELPDACEAFLEGLMAGGLREVEMADPLAGLQGVRPDWSRFSPTLLAASGLAMWSP
ncbi:pilus assembly protein PilM [Halomonas cupida]